MALIHDVIDSDVRFIIDPVTRTISNQESKKLVLTRGDHNSERFTFEIPRYVEGHDMSLCNVVRIHFINTDSRTREEMADIYEPDDASLLDTNDQLFTFSWLISRTATSFAGPLAFAIEFQCVVDGTVVYSWRTAANSTITIVDGINNANSTDVEVDEPPTDIYATIRVATVASMIHDVIDSDVRFVIDPVTRTISNQDSKKLMLIRGDHKSERFTFEIPRVVEGHDMSLCNVVRVHYINTNSKTRSVMTDVYEPTDMRVPLENGDIVTFSWLVGRSATTFAGTLAFSIEFQCVVDDIVEYSWHTGINNTIAISDGISNAEVLNEEYSDILTIWWERLYSSSELPIEIITTEMLEELGDSIRDNTLYILEDDPTLAEIEKVIEDVKEFNVTLTKHLKQYETLDKSMAEHLKKYTELDKNIADHFEKYESLLTEVDELEERVNKLEKLIGTECKHNWVTTVVEPTCTTRGYTLYECDKCGDSYKDSYTDTTEHNYVNGICTVCGKTDSGETTCEQHTWIYTQQGPDLWDRYCSVCKVEENDVEFPCTDGTEHSWVELDVTTPTCTAAGIRRYMCEKCDVVKYGEVVQEALGHNYVNGICTVCGKSEPGGETCDHTLVFDTSKEPTCTEDGYERFRCSKCTVYYEDTVAKATGHTLGSPIYDVVGAYEPTCITPGYAAFVCTKCKAEVWDTVPATGDHSWSDAIYDAAGYFEPTCTEAGYAGYVCTKCGGEKSETVPALQHSYKSVVTPPTCSAKGYTTYTCTVCGYDYTANEVPATGNHSDEEYSVVPAKCTETGSVTYKCSVCGYEHTETISALQHSYNETTVPATCTAAGSTIYTCTREGCGYSYTVTIDPLGHDYVEEPVDPDDRNDDVSSDGYVDVCIRCGDRNYENHT